MAEKTKRTFTRAKNRRRGFVAIPFRGLLTVGTPVDGIVTKGGIFGNNFGEDIFIISIDSTWSLVNATSGEVPLSFGFVYSDLGVTEIGEALDAELTSPDDIIQKERAKRPVRRVGQFAEQAQDHQF